MNKLSEMSTEFLERIQKENEYGNSIEGQQALRDSAKEFLKNGLPFANGPDGTFTYNPENRKFEVSIEQAKRSAVPKPDGNWIDNYGVEVVEA